ncbi:hypothetical protein ACFQ0T_01995 [Kitasatospora gansuensis]
MTERTDPPMGEHELTERQPTLGELASGLRVVRPEDLSTPAPHTLNFHGQTVYVTGQRATVNVTPRAEVSWPLTVGPVPAPDAATQPRTEAAQRLAEALAEHRSVLLSGPGGVGKSQLVAAHVQHALATGAGRFVLWADATDGPSLTASYADAAQQLLLPGLPARDLDRRAAAFLEWFRTPGPSALVVLDNLADPALLADRLPHSAADDRRVIATTRLRGASTGGVLGTVVSLESFGPDESLAFLRKRIRASAEAAYLAEEEHTPRLSELAEELGHLPLALGYAATAMVTEELTADEYLDELRERARTLDEVLTPDPGGIGVTAALLLSLEAAERRRPKGAAAPALRLAAWYDPVGHPERLWQAPVVRELLTGQGAEEYQGVGRRGIGDAALRVLHEYGLLTHSRMGRAPRRPDARPHRPCGP